MKDSDVSVIIPLYNRPRLIVEAVQSVLNQTVLPREIIVVDDGSTDESVAAVPVHPIVKVIALPHAGIASTMNHGVGLAQGSILAFLDSDDRWTTTKLEKQLARLNSTSGDELIFCLVRIFQDDQEASQPEEIVSGITKPTMILRRTLFDLIGPFPEGKGAHDFIDWYARAQELGLATHVIPEVLYERRIHDGNDGILQRDSQRANYFASLKNMLNRRRKNESS